MIGKGVHFLSRLRFGVNIYEPDGTPIQLKSLLKRGRKVDKQVLISANKIPARLVMIHLPVAVSAEKKRKAKNDRDKRLNHSKEYYQWLEFNTYITTVDEATWTSEQVAEAYKVRWQIELIFKSWKSGGLHMQKLLHDRCTNADRVKVCIYLLLLFALFFCRELYLPVVSKMVKTARDEIVSMVKMLGWVVDNIKEVMKMSERKFYQTVFEQCCYEKRKYRENMIQTITKCKS